MIDYNYGDKSVNKKNCCVDLMFRGLDGIACAFHFSSACSRTRRQFGLVRNLFGIWAEIR